MMSLAWSLERKISLAALGAILMQSASVLIWAGQTAQRIEQLERNQPPAQHLSERIARLEEQAEFIRDTLQRIEYKIEHPTRAPRPQ